VIGRIARAIELVAATAIGWYCAYRLVTAFMGGSALDRAIIAAFPVATAIAYLAWHFSQRHAKISN
jgi:hypothetical protein